MAPPDAGAGTPPVAPPLLASLRVSRVVLASTLLATVVAVFTAFLVSAEVRTVALPALLALVTFAWFFARLAAHSRAAPVDDAGAWFGASTAVYLFMPVAVYFALGMEFTPLNDVRLWSNGIPTPADIGEVVWYNTLFVIGFAVPYAIGRVRLGPAPEATAPRRVDLAFVLPVVIFVVLTNAFFVVVGLLVDLGSDTYEGSYLAIQQLPLALRQAWNAFIRMRWPLTLLLMLLMFQRYGRWRLVLWGWLAFEIAQQFVMGGSRAALFIFLAAALFLYHSYVRPLSTRFVAFAAIAGLLAFQALGFLRDLQSVATGEGGFSPLGSGGEFEVLFGNAYDLLLRTRAGEVHPPLGLYLSDFAALIPSQLLPFQKIDSAEWYLRTFYPAVWESGGGFAFGVIAQAIVGLGKVEALLRGVVTALLLLGLRRLYLRRRENPWVVVAYLWFCLFGYLTFRMSTFYLLAPFIYGFVPAVLMVTISRAALRHAFRSPSPEEGGAVSPATTS